MGDHYPVVKVAAVQACPVFLNREASTEKACRYILEAGRNGAKIIVFPEGFIPTHPLWYIFHPGTGETAVRMSMELFKNSVEVPGPETEMIGEAAKAAGAYVVMGCCEKRPNTTGTMYNTMLFYNPDGELIFKHQKFMPTVGERFVHALGGPETMGVVQGEYGPMSGLLCSENVNPLAIFSAIMGGTRFHAAAWPNFWGTQSMRSHVEVTTRNISRMAKCFTISACATVDEDMIERMQLSKADADYLRRPDVPGGSMIASPLGDLIAGPMGSEEGILYADCNVEDCIRYKLEHDFAGHYNRPDIFTVIQRKAPLHLFVEDSYDAYAPGMPEGACTCEEDQETE